MNFIINLVGKYIVLYSMRLKQAVGIIENDLGLIRYILKILRRYEVSTENGYLKFENRRGEVYLHRIIMEYYAQFNDKLFTILNNTEMYQVNHKNKLKWDNRLENLELVTLKGNQRHRRGLKYEDEIVMTSEEILNIKNDLMKKKQYKSDKKYLEKVSARNLKILSEKDIYWGCDRSVFDNSYIRFNNNFTTTYKIPSTTIDINTLMYLNNIIFMCIKNTFFTTNNIESLCVNYNMYRYKNIIINNLKLLSKYYTKSNIFRELCHKHKLLDSKYINSSDSIEYLNHNILLDIFLYLLPSPLPITFYKNQLFTSTSLQHVILSRGKYNSFKVLYYTELLKRQKVPFTTTSHTVSSFLIPEYTDNLFTSTVLPLSEKLHKQNLTKITHTILTKNDDLQTAQKVYKNSTLKKKTELDFITIEDIKTVLLSSTIQDKITQYGFFTVSDIRRELQLLNEEREEKFLPYIKIRDTDDRFITSIIRNTTEMKEILKEMNVEYRIVKKHIKEKIKQYQIKNKIEEITTTGLTKNKRIIVLKKLTVQKKRTV